MHSFTLTALMAMALSVSSTTVLAGESATGAVPVKVQHGDGRFWLERGNHPYVIQGAGIEYGNKRRFRDRGGNSFRTWRTDNGQQTGQEVLDEALSLGLTVVMCIEITPERKGFDYNDAAAVQAQLEYARGEVLKYRDHPALLAWMIGNEPNLFFENPLVFDAINDIAVMIDELDPHHPTTTALAGFNAELAELIETRAPALDFLSIQMYGDLINLPRYIEEAGYTRPFMVTEWGSIGHWEVGKTAWDAPIEMNSTAKADNYLLSHEKVLKPLSAQLLGNYVFLWGNKQERTPTWYGMFLDDGSSTATVDVMQYVWTGNWPSDRAPAIGDIRLDSRTAADSIVLQAGQTVTAVAEATDPEDAALTWQWVLMEESRATQSGGDKEAVPAIITGRVNGQDGTVTLEAPDTAGPYRLFVYVRDSAGNAAHANVPFRVEE